MNWIATYYTEGNDIISAHVIKDRTEQEAEKEAIADMPMDCDDWTLMPEPTDAEKKQTLRKLYTLDEICEILGYFDESNPDLNYPMLKIDEEFSPSTFEETILGIAINNGNFEEAVLTNVKFDL